ncbi:MAG TPA: lmo0937 family membrane protein [Opitutaceae bacterium]|nr:lmo0937 family membrane protein [Opitutaceae bacterium]
MLEVLATVLLIAWLLCLMAAYTFGGAVHLLLALALIFIAIRLIRRPKDMHTHDVSRR